MSGGYRRQLLNLVFEVAYRIQLLDVARPKCPARIGKVLLQESTQ
jgi:hypothetical protein